MEGFPLHAQLLYHKFGLKIAEKFTQILFYFIEYRILNKHSALKPTLDLWMIIDNDIAAYFSFSSSWMFHRSGMEKVLSCMGKSVSDHVLYRMQFFLCTQTPVEIAAPLAYAWIFEQQSGLLFSSILAKLALGLSSEMKSMGHGRRIDRRCSNLCCCCCCF